jgi:hypothetical protein
MWKIDGFSHYPLVNSNNNINNGIYNGDIMGKN